MNQRDLGDRPLEGSFDGAGVQRRTWGIVVAGGSGARFGDRKQLAELRGKRVLDWSLDALRPFVAGLVAVVPADLLAPDGSIPVGSPLAQQPLDADIVIAGGSSRSDSVRAGLSRLPSSASWVLVHDAARPLASADLVRRVVCALADTDAVVPVIGVTDTLRRAAGGSVDRSEFVAVQTPQGFRVAALRSAHARGDDASDDASLIDRDGGAVTHVEGDPRNFKITVSQDLAMAELLLGEVVA